MDKNKFDLNKIDLMDFTGEHDDMFLSNFPTVDEFIDKLESYSHGAQMRGLRQILANHLGIALSKGKY